MQVIRYVLASLYRLWFYILVTTVTLVLFPLLFLSILKHQWYGYFYKLARLWSLCIIYGMGNYPVVNRMVNYTKGESYVFVANHTSMLDIMLMFYCSKNPFVFIGKKELSNFPFFGTIYKRTCILVDRSSAKSRIEAFKNARKRINEGMSICIFPEGGVPDDYNLVLDHFKDGAFKLAIEHKIPVAPMTFLDNKKRFPYDWFKGHPGKMRATLHPLLYTDHLHSDDRKVLKEEVRKIILEELQQPSH